jgi:hypothetical protein
MAIIRIRPRRREAAGENRGITQVSVCGYKSIGPEQAIEIRPLTILAGANSSGKSSMMQPLLLLKQTLEAPYDPGMLLLNGPNIKFTSAEQLLYRGGKTGQASEILIGMRTSADDTLRLLFDRGPGKKLDVRRMVTRTGSGQAFDLRPEMSQQEVFAQEPVAHLCSGLAEDDPKLRFEGRIIRSRCFLRVEVYEVGGPEEPRKWAEFAPGATFARLIQQLIHLPGLRGNPERSYPVSSVGSAFPGTFEKYAASAIANWVAEGQDEKLSQLNESLRSLGLTWKVAATALDDTQVELKVGRLPRPARGGAHDLVNIADVGFGVSQALPVVTALLAAQPGQLVYLEQPEIHLHPRAQVTLARVLANAANRGVQVVAETHSSLLLLGVQALVAEGHLTPDKVKLHWFRRSEDDGATTIVSADLDPAGRFHDWPEDFDDVTMDAQVQFLNAVERRQEAR